MKKVFITLAVTALATHLPAPGPGGILAISSLGNGDWQVVATAIENLPLHQTVYVLESTTNFVDWTAVITNKGIIPIYFTNIVHSTNPTTFYRASVTWH